MIIGIDEVGRGCWAGPVVAGAVALEEDFTVPSTDAWALNDSKQLTKLQRQKADYALRALGIDFGLGWVSATELDVIGLSAAVALAMRRALDLLPSDSRRACSEIIIDGSYNFLSDVPDTKAVIKADGRIAAVSAASILAKVARDRWMIEAAVRFPGYGFEKHVGYGTALHREALAVQGVCTLHRRSFRPIAALEDREKTSSAVAL